MYPYGAQAGACARALCLVLEALLPARPMGSPRLPHVPHPDAGFPSPPRVRSTSHQSYPYPYPIQFTANGRRGREKKRKKKNKEFPTYQKTLFFFFYARKLNHVPSTSPTWQQLTPSRGGGEFNSFSLAFGSAFFVFVYFILLFF